MHTNTIAERIQGATDDQVYDITSRELELELDRDVFRLTSSAVTKATQTHSRYPLWEDIAAVVIASRLRINK